MRTKVMLVAMAMAACGGDDDPVVPEPPDIETLEFAAFLGVNISQMTRHPSGLYYLDVVEGDGPLASTDIGVQITFQGWLHDGTAVDAGVYPGGPQSPGSVLGLDGEWYYLLGSGQTIAGWDIGIDGMRQGGERKLVIPPDLAFGALGSADGRVPPNAVLVYDIALLGVEP